MLYVLLLLILAGLIYAGWRVVRAKDSRRKTRVIGPDDDPEFLEELARRIKRGRGAGNDA